MSAPSLEARLACRERPAGRPALHMRWENLLFLHWKWDPDEIQKTLPHGLQVDLFNDQAWLAVVPFFMRRVHPSRLPCVPWLSDFLELNVRTYVYDASGKPGVWFYSLACNQPIAVELARRFFHLNYVHARMSAEFGKQGISYFSQRRKRADFLYSSDGATREAEPGSLEFFLVERYHLFSANSKGRLFHGQVHHQPYRIGPAEVGAWSFQPAIDEGFAPLTRPPDHVRRAEILAVSAWPLRPSKHESPVDNSVLDTETPI